MVLSVDYDNHGFALFPEKLVKERWGGQLEDIERFKSKLEVYFAKVTEGADEVVLMVGSDRQTRGIDKLNQEKNENGSCIENYRIYAAQKGWVFSEFSAVSPQGFALSTTYVPHARLNFSQEPHRDKVGLIGRQMIHIKDSYPEAEITFAFSDDYPEAHAMKDVQKKYFSEPGRIPVGMTLQLTKADYYEDVTESKLGTPMAPFLIATRAGMVHSEPEGSLLSVSSKAISVAMAVGAGLCALAFWALAGESGRDRSAVSSALKQVQEGFRVK